MPSEQVAFDFTTRPPAPVEIGEVEIMLNFLSNHPGFHTREQITEATGLSDRAVRMCAAKNRDLILSGPGSPGYCHLYHSTMEAVNRYTSPQISQGKQMIRGAIQTRNAAIALVAKGRIPHRTESLTPPPDLIP